MEVVAGAEALSARTQVELRAEETEPRPAEQRQPQHEATSGASRRSRASSSRPSSRTSCPRSTTRSRSTAARTSIARLRGAAAPRRRPRPRGRDGLDRRPRPRHARSSTPAARSRCPSARATLGRIFNVLGDTIDLAGPVGNEERWPIHRPAPDGREPHADDRDVRDRHQGRRPARALRQGRQGRPVRRRRRRQDRPHPGADPQPRQGARRPVGLLRRRRALARGQRPVARDEGVGRHRQDDARLRPDERAARRAHARRAVRPDDGGVLPRAGPGRAAVHRQHLPLRAGRLRGLRAAGPHALAGRLPADARDRDGPAAGADHVDPPGLGHVGAGDLRAGRRPHRPGAGLGVRPPQRDDGALARDLGEGHLPGRRPARLDLDDPQAGHPRRGALQRRQRGQADPPALQGAAGHHRDPRHRRAVRRGQARSCSARARSSASCSQPFHVAEQFTGTPGAYVPIAETIRGFKEIIEGKHDELPERVFLLKGTIDDVVAAAKG